MWEKINLPTRKPPVIKKQQGRPKKKRTKEPDKLTEQRDKVKKLNKKSLNRKVLKM